VYDERRNSALGDLLSLGERCVLLYPCVKQPLHVLNVVVRPKLDRQFTKCFNREGQGLDHTRPKHNGTDMAPSATVAQTAPPTYQGYPDVYKVIFEDQNFRVISATRKKGVHDKVHGHPAPSIVYFLTDCTTKQYASDGKTHGECRQSWFSKCGPSHRLAFG
jgi:hypothetical protein